MVIISLDMRGLSHAMMVMFCVNGRKVIELLRALVTGNSVRPHNFKIIQAVKTILLFYDQNRITLKCGLMGRI